MDYKEIALQLFDELSDVYVEDIEKHADLFRRYPQLSDEWWERLRKSFYELEIPDGFDMEDEKIKL